MKITTINSALYQRSNFSKPNKVFNSTERNNTSELTGTNYVNQINFRSLYKPERTVIDIGFEEYKGLKESTKQRYRKLYKIYDKNPFINKEDLVDPKYQYLPLQSEERLDKFFDISKEYLKYKGHPIVCLGRSPKWFLNTALWMKDGIDNYTFVAFSKYWYLPDKQDGARKIDRMAPLPEEEAEYKKYLKAIGSDPKTLVQKAKETGKKVIITDYVCSGKGMCSFLDLMGRYAEEQGVLDEFGNSIKIVGIGSMDYMENLNPYAEYVSEPSVPLPKILWPYYRKIEQVFHNMDYVVFKEMLLNQNSNECRSTYYPHETWTLYKPNQFKTGIIKDFKKVQKLIERSKTEKCTTSFKPAMAD